MNRTQLRAFIRSERAIRAAYNRQQYERRGTRSPAYQEARGRRLEQLEHQKAELAKQKEEIDGSTPDTV